MTATTTAVPDREVTTLGTFQRRLLAGPPREQLLDDEEFDSELTTYLDSLVGPETKLLSIDVFDTALIRRPIAEVSRFVAIATRQAASLAERAIGQPPTALDLLVSRLQATHASYRLSEPRNGHREGSIIEITKAMEHTLGLRRAAHRTLIDEELAYEATVTVANRPLCRWLEARQRDGIELLLLSDMYLHAEHIRQLLDATGVLPGTPVTSSADQKVTKHSGSAYPALLTTTGLEPTEIVHLGDNLRSDYQLARHHGIRSGHLPIPESERAMIAADERTTMDELRGLGHDVSRWI